MNDKAKLRLSHHRSGMAVVLVIIVLIIAVLLGFFLIFSSRENRFAVRRYYLSIMTDTLLAGAWQEGDKWLEDSFYNLDVSPQITAFMTAPDNDASALEDLSIPLQLPHSQQLAAELGLAFTANISFRNVRPVYPPAVGVGVNFNTQGIIGRDNKECFGIVVLAIKLEHSDFTKEVKLQREFKIINILPPLVSKFTLFVKNQDPAKTDKGSPRHLNNLLLATEAQLCKGLISDKSECKPLHVINSGRDWDPTGNPVSPGGAMSSTARQPFEPADVTSNFMNKGWVFLGTPSPDGFILNLTSGQLVDYLGGKINCSLYSTPTDIGLRYAGERFHRPDIAELMATTFDTNPSIFKLKDLNGTTSFPAEVTADSVPGIKSLRIKLQFFNFCSVSMELSTEIAGLEAL
ncbi:MAG: hypothetical protein JRC99_12510, partial [Deltaproteobacteria bacterium]|nr:hypothetical protein [Deltaproteobacteria bacterium]